MHDGPKGDHAEVNGLEMYHGVHGSGEPLALVHGGVDAVEIVGRVLPLLVEGLRVVAVDLRATGSLPGS